MVGSVAGALAQVVPSAERNEGSVEPTLTANTDLPLVIGEFETLTDGLDYAARGETGLNFYGGRGELIQAVTYGEIRDQAIDLAQRLTRAGLRRGARMAIIAETDPQFIVFFFACQYAGPVPVALPYAMNLGGRDAYLERLRAMMISARPDAAACSGPLLGYLTEATKDLPIRMVGSHQDFWDLPATGGDLRPLGPSDACYIQYSSGSTRQPQGVAISQRSITTNCRAIGQHGLRLVRGDRATSWLPLYHDMGLVGFMLTPTLSQITVDYISTADFARRPFVWLKTITKNSSTISFSPTFGYELCLRRAVNGAAKEIDLRSWRVAGIGGEMVRGDILKRFSDTFQAHGFDPSAFLPSYGLAEATLAVSFAALSEGIKIDTVERRELAFGRRAVKAKTNGALDTDKTRSFVVCGKVLPGHEMEIRDEAGNALPERHLGRVVIHGPSVMEGYFGDAESKARMRQSDGWLDTGDMGYMVDGELVITGRSKDLIISNGRNIWPQDIEWAVERMDGLRRGDAAAFSVSDDNGPERVVVVVQCRLSDPTERETLRHDVHAIVRQTAGVESEVVLAPHRSLPFTSSGKLSRSAAKAEYLAGAFEETKKVQPQAAAVRRAEAMAVGAD